MGLVNTKVQEADGCAAARGRIREALVPMRTQYWRATSECKDPWASASDNVAWYIWDSETDMWTYLHYENTWSVVFIERP